MANIASNLDTWSATAASNQPDTTDTQGMVADMQEIQAVVRKYLATKGSDIASSGTTDLSTATGLRVDITGTTTITAFGTLTAGMWKILKFTGILTLTYNATSLKLPTAANITTAAGDSCLALSLGSGNWEVLFYQRYDGSALAASLASFGVTASAAELNIMDGVTSSTAELNILDGVTASAAELNIMDGVTATTAEINKLAGTPAGLTATELGYVDGVTSAIQTQLNAKAASGANTDITSLNAPSLGGATATTQTAGNNTTKVATTAFVTTAVAAVGGGFTIGTPVTTTSGTTADFTGIPSGTTVIHIGFEDVSAGGVTLRVQIGDAGGFETSGYVGKSISAIVGTSTAGTTFSSGFDGTASIGSVGANGVLTLVRMDSGGTKWAISGVLTYETGANDTADVFGGSKTLTAELTQVRVSVTSGAFDNGTINVAYS